MRSCLSDAGWPDQPVQVLIPLGSQRMHATNSGAMHMFCRKLSLLTCWGGSAVAREQETKYARSSQLDRMCE